MDFWNGIGDFFATFEPKDWVTAAIALVAISVSVFTASQTWRYHPRPRLVVEYKGILDRYTPTEYDSTNTPGVWIGYANRGNEAAFDVRFTVHSPTFDGPVVNRLDIVEPGPQKRWSWDLMPESEREWDLAAGGFKPYTLPSDTVDRKKVKVVISWRQSPTLWLKRKKTVRFSRDIPYS